MRRPTIVLVAILILVPALLIGYRVISLKYPPLPTVPGKAWSLSLDAAVKGEEGKEVHVMIALPQDRGDWAITEEQIESGALSFSLVREGLTRTGLWSGQLYGEEGLIAYRAIIVASRRPPPKPSAPALRPYAAEVEREEQALAKRLMAGFRAIEAPARVRAVSSAFRGSWGERPPEEGALQAWDRLRERHGPRTALLVLLRAAEVPARLVTGLRLSEGIEPDTITWVEAWTGVGWERLDSDSGALYRPSEVFLPLNLGEEPPIRFSDGEVSQVCWTIHRATLSKWRMHYERLRTSRHLLDRWSLFRLPEEFQETFRILLLVPIGALMICVLRNMIGFPTFGVFMPVLMALAFRNTGLSYGLTIFAGIVLLGYLVRRRLDRLRLLLVPRLSVILTVVIALFTVLALVGSKTGQRELMAVGLIPFVILTMTIERFFVVIEEAGPRAGLRTAVGSAVVAAMTHQIVQWEPLQLTFFVYPELLFAVAAFQVLIGRYTGYRLSELIRFRAFRREET